MPKNSDILNGRPLSRYRVRNLKDSEVKFTHSQLNTEAEMTKLHMAIYVAFLDNIIPKKDIPASFQPQ